MKRDPETARAWQRRSRRLRPMSAKRAAQQRERRKALQSFAPNPMCRMPSCSKPAEDGHEPGMRSRGANPADVNEIVPVCRACHDWIHANPKAATEIGMMIPSWERAR